MDRAALLSWSLESPTFLVDLSIEGSGDESRLRSWKRIRQGGSKDAIGCLWR